MGAVRALAQLFPLVVTTIALAFVVQSFTTRDWAHQSYYPIVDNLVTQEGETQWFAPSFSKYRSPFEVCTYDLSDPEVLANKGNPTSNLTQIDIICVRYPIYGAGKTSCETPTRFDSNFSVAETIRDDRMCEQIHYSGNLLVAAIVFVSIALAVALPLTFYSMMRQLNSDDERAHGAPLDGTRKSETEAVASEQGQDLQQEARGPGNEKPTAISTTRAHRRRKFGVPGRGERPGVFIAAATFVLIVCLAISAVATFLSQFYGILGLIQSNPENGQFAYSVTPPPTLPGSITYGPWVQGKALSTYLSLGWLFSAISAGAAGGIWSNYLHRR